MGSVQSAYLPQCLTRLFLFIFLPLLVLLAIILLPLPPFSARQDESTPVSLQQLLRVCSEMMRVGKAHGESKEGKRVHDQREDLQTLFEEIVYDYGLAVDLDPKAAETVMQCEHFVILLEEALSHMPEHVFSLAYDRVILMQQSRMVAAREMQEAKLLEEGGADADEAGEGKADGPPPGK